MESLSSESKSIALDILEDILSAIERLEERTKDIHSIDDFTGSSSGMVLLDATCMLLIAIGESLKNLDKTTDGLLLPTYPSIPWKNVKGLRDIIAHHYFDVDASDEKGTHVEAITSTSFATLSELSKSTRAEFYANRPFIYFIRDYFGSICFAGVYRGGK
jgi:uncharacterized protein with HEPN domain